MVTHYLNLMWVENMTKTPNILLTAVRQYQHNDCSGLLFGFDHDETINVVISLEIEIRTLKSELKSALKKYDAFIAAGC